MTNEVTKTALPAASLRYAIRALRREIFQFRFDYPLEIVPEAGPKESLHYYLYSEKLSWSVMSMDSKGIPRARGRLTGEVYKPAYIAWWGLVNLGHFLRHEDKASRDVFLNQLNWLECYAVRRADGAVVWPNPFDCIQGATVLKAPWVSAYDQGMVISTLVRGYRLTRKPHLLDLLTQACKIFELEVSQNGVRVSLGSSALYAELPGGPSPGILDGFMTSLLGLYDLFVETGDPKVGQLFEQGIEGLKCTLHEWDYRSKWSWYGGHAYLCPPSYHCLNRALLTVLARLSSEPCLAQYANSWDPHHLSKFARAEIFLGFLLTKNACRIRHRTWRQSPATVVKNRLYGNRAI
jgi:heparosan-N-sulfate-glucuronate 5-epimerase